MSSRKATTTQQLRYLAGLIDGSGSKAIVLKDDDVILSIYSKSQGHIENLIDDVLHLDSTDVKVQVYKSGSSLLKIHDQYFAAPLTAALHPYLVCKRDVVDEYLKSHNRSVRAQAPLSAAYVCGVFDSRNGYAYWNFWYDGRGWRHRYKNIRFVNPEVNYLWRIRRFLGSGIVSVDEERGSNVRDLFILDHDIFQLRLSDATHIQRVADEILLPLSTYPEKRAFLTEKRGEKVWTGRASSRGRVVLQSP